MQKQARGTRANFVAGIQGIAQYGMADGHHVQAQLMSSARDGLKFNPGCAFCFSARLAPPPRVAGFSMFPIHFASGAVGPIDEQGQLNVLPAAMSFVS
jgi:hypothetical protein